MRLISFILSCTIALSCEKVIELKPTSNDSRLIIDALIRIDEDAPPELEPVRVRKTNGFFEEIPVTQLMQITLVTNPSSGEPLIFIEYEPGSGNYEEFVTAFDEEKQLIFQIDHEDQLYLAHEYYKPTIQFEVDYVGQTNSEHEVRITFQDDPDKRDFYLFDFGEGEFLPIDDELFNGQAHTFSYFFERELASEEEVQVSLLGSDERLNKYMAQLIDQSKKEFGPFETPVSTVRGNIINVTEIDNIDFFDNVDQPDNYPLGYFALVQEIKKTFIVE